jgi:hypothetical protein
MNENEYLELQLARKSTLIDKYKWNKEMSIINLLLD